MNSLGYLKQTDYISKISHIENIKERNEAFDALSKADQRREIAYDCLTLLDREILAGTSGTYWNSQLDNIAFDSIDANEFQKKLLNLQPDNHCRACARGAMMLCQIRLSNQISPIESQIYDGSGWEADLKKRIKGFTFKTYLKMEGQYEHNWDNDHYYSNTSENLGNICLNILKNGNYHSSDKKDYLQSYANKRGY